MMTSVENHPSKPDKAIGAILASLDEQITRQGIDIDALKQEIEKLTLQVREREKDVSRIREAKRQLTLIQTTQLEAEEIASEALKVPEGFAKRHAERKNGQAWQVRQQAYLILKETGHPLSRAELLEKMTAAGFVIDSPRPLHRIGKILWEAKDAFVYHDNGYWLVGEPVTEPVERIKRFRTRKPRKKKTLET